MEYHEIVPDVIPVAPKDSLQICYSNNVIVYQGNELTPTQVKDAPQKVQWPADKNSYYTLCMTDPDAPSRAEPIRREWHHWLIGNILGNNLETGDILSAYIGSGPPRGSGLHRYVFLIYKQPGKLTFDEKRLTATSPDNRGCFSIHKFAEKYNLGNPIAGNFYLAQFDDYVPILRKTLGFQ